MDFEAGVVGQLVDAFLSDHSGIHVGDEQALAAGGEGLHHHVDRQVLQRGAQPLRNSLIACAARRKEKVGGDAGIENANILRGRKHSDGERHRRIVEHRTRGIRNESGDVSHSDGSAGKAVLIAGPTASGKSTLALGLAEQIGGTVINADSMQVYRDLHVITARPTPEEEARAPHRLYGHVDASVNFSAGAWVADATKVLAEARAAGRMPIFIGGSGLYFKALTRG